MFNFKLGRCKNTLQQSFSSCFDPLKDELGTVPTELHSNKHVCASMIAICDAYAAHMGIKKIQSVAIITDAAFEEIFRREATQVLTHTDQWKDANDNEFTASYQAALERVNQSLAEHDDLELNWLRDYLVSHFERSRNLML